MTSTLAVSQAAILPFHPIGLRSCTYLGGTGYSIHTPQVVTLEFRPSELAVLDGGGVDPIPYIQVTDLAISGPGAVTTGGGFIGGGFGIGAALEGMALAGVLNSLTTKTRVHTFISITTHVGELHLHYGGMEPGALRIVLAPVYSNLRRLDPAWMQQQADRLLWLQERGLIGAVEHKHFVTQLLSGGTASSEGAARNQPSVESEAEIIARCEAELRSMGFEVVRPAASRWEIRGSSGATFAYSAQDLRDRTRQLTPRSTAGESTQNRS